MRKDKRPVVGDGPLSGSTILSVTMESSGTRFVRDNLALNGASVRHRHVVVGSSVGEVGSVRDPFASILSWWFRMRANVNRVEICVDHVRRWDWWLDHRPDRVVRVDLCGREDLWELGCDRFVDERWSTGEYPQKALYEQGRFDCLEMDLGEKVWQAWTDCRGRIQAHMVELGYDLPWFK